MRTDNSEIELEGQIEKITYSSDETGYTVARMSISGYHEPVTIVGNMIAPIPGEVLRVKGSWTSHPRFGKQFKVSSYHVKVPPTLHGMKKYLGSGLIKGIGPVMASRIVRKFGAETLDIIENRTEELLNIEGIGKKRVHIIREAWKDQREMRDLMMFLASYDVGAGYAARIFKRYGQGSLTVLKRNPYILATEIQGIGFSIADSIARKLGFRKEEPFRAEAGILYALNQLADEGHVYYPYENLVKKCREILDVERDIIAKAFGSLALDRKIIIEDINEDLEGFEPNRKAVYLARHYISEDGITGGLLRLISAKKNIRRVDAGRAAEAVEKDVGLNFARNQIEAIKSAVTNKVIVITGGPGTGKTTIINAVILIYRDLGARISLAAPTGRAAKRMSEAAGYPAKTIHRMLEYSLQRGGFQRNQDNPIEADILILDEVSMIDNILMYHLLKAVPENATLILVGDVNQLPSVGPGNVLRDIIKSDKVPVVELTEIFRQAGKSRIVVNAHRINRGIMPEFYSGGRELEDFYFIEQEDPDQVLGIIVELVCKRIPDRFGFDPFNDIQVLAPMHKGIVGTENLNQRMQNALNPNGTSLSRGERTFRLHDKVMQIRNNYEKDIFNGDIGRISLIDPENRELAVDYDSGKVPYDFSDLDEIVLAYAISVHKSQGSEYPAIVLPVLSQHYLLLQRNLIYTGITRGKNLVIIVGSKKALAIAVKNDRVAMRYSYLCERLRNDNEFRNSFRDPHVDGKGFEKRSRLHPW
ncbi:MAG: ATP-dependent RecD-like DNA helicase [Deltaproteobacteria bacterium]|nr:ATP-dependent RecD-like DNA helicase [Deltaproteobacteria bacterium]